MKPKLILAILVIVVATLFGAVSFVETNVEYTNFTNAAATRKRVQVKGEWMREAETTYDAKASRFSFSMKDDGGRQERVLFDGAKPNNFEIASSVVVKGRYEDGYFHATDILTKCPSKYEAEAESMKRTL